MSSVKLLDDTRKINQILHRKNSGKVAFNDICEAMRSVLSSDSDHWGGFIREACDILRQEEVL